MNGHKDGEIECEGELTWFWIVAWIVESFVRLDVLLAGEQIAVLCQ